MSDVVGESHAIISNLGHVMNASGMCLFGYLTISLNAVEDFMNSVSGWNLSFEDYLKVGARIASLRQAFNVREGQNLFHRNLPGRLAGDPHLTAGPLAGITADIKNTGKRMAGCYKVGFRNR